MSSSQSVIKSALIQGQRWTNIDDPLTGRSNHSPLGSPVVVTYGFYNTRPSGEVLPSWYVDTFRSLDESQRSNVRSAFSAWDTSCGVAFVETDSSRADIRICEITLPTGYLGMSYYPNSGIGGDIFFGKYSSWEKYGTAAHEIGHSIGLKHPFEGYVRLPASEDCTTNTVMSYNDIGADGLPYDPNAPQPYDVIAVQSIYGKDVPLTSMMSKSPLEYIASYSDLCRAFGANEQAGAQHYFSSGQFEGRTTTFDGLEYIASYSDLSKAFSANAQAGASHFITFGRSEGRTTTFDGLEYIAGYQDLSRAFGANADAGAAHFINYGRKEGRTTAFDASAYLAAYSDLRTAFGTNKDAAAAHYINFGRKEGRTCFTHTVV